jgi:hypothetical protein
MINNSRFVIAGTFEAVEGSNKGIIGVSDVPSRNELVF